MDSLITSTGSWWLLLFTAAFLLGLFFLLEFCWRLVQALNLKPGPREFLHKWLWRTRIVYEPIAIGILVVAFVLINPLVHGIAATIVVAGAFPHFRNYLSGRLFRLENSLRMGEEINVGTVSGEVIRMGRLGIKVRESNGLHHIGYHRLVNDGYVLTSGSETGDFFNLLIKAENEEKAQNTEKVLISLFATAPYVDWAVRPEVVLADPDNAEWSARVQLRAAGHLPELVRLLNEVGYMCNSQIKP